MSAEVPAWVAEHRRIWAQVLEEAGYRPPALDPEDMEKAMEATIRWAKLNHVHPVAAGIAVGVYLGMDQAQRAAK